MSAPSESERPRGLTERPRGLVIFPADAKLPGRAEIRAADWWPIVAALVVAAAVIAAALILR